MLPTVQRCLETTSIIEGSHSGVRLRVRGVTNWEGRDMALPWMAAAHLDTDKSLRRIMGYRDLWILRSALDADQDTKQAMVT